MPVLSMRLGSVRLLSRIEHLECEMPAGAPSNRPLGQSRVLKGHDIGHVSMGLRHTQVHENADQQVLQSENLASFFDHAANA